MNAAVMLNLLRPAAAMSRPPFRFYLGTDRPSWLYGVDRGRPCPGLGVPLFVSRRTLGAPGGRRAVCDWALDSGAFTEVTKYGRFRFSAGQYADFVLAWQRSAGRLAFAAPMDWMCEPAALKVTGLSVAEHQRRTTENYLELRALAGPVVAPVLQGWAYGDYMRHLDDYARAGIDLAGLPVVGLGGVCRRQDVGPVVALVKDLAGMGLRLHCFGFKTTGVKLVRAHAASSDSMAWCRIAWKRKIRLEGCTHKNRYCCHCPAWALRWREVVLAASEPPAPRGARQLELWG